MEQKMVIISGASGTLGRAYVEHFSKEDGVRCIALTRRDEPVAGAETIRTDLLDAEGTAATIEQFTLENVNEITLIHPVGMFKFEEHGTPESDSDEDGIDDEILASNISTLDNLANPLLKKIGDRDIPLTICAFGSLSDPHNIKYWQSYSKAKNILRAHMRELAATSGERVRCVFFSVSTVNTEKERTLRPHADSAYWLTTDELVTRSLPYLEHPENWKDVEIFRPMPGFTPEYYSDQNAIREKWGREMGRKLL